MPKIKSANTFFLIIFSFSALIFQSCRMKNKVLHEKLVDEHALMEKQLQVIIAKHDSLESHYMIMIEKRLNKLENIINSKVLKTAPIAVYSDETKQDSLSIDSLKAPNVDIVQTKSLFAVGPLIVQHKELIEEYKILIENHKELLNESEHGNVNLREIEEFDKKLIKKEKSISKKHDKIIETTAPVLF